MTEILSPTDAEKLNEALEEVRLIITGHVGLEQLNTAIRLLMDVRNAINIFDLDGVPPDQLRIGNIIKAPNGEHCFVTGHPWVSGIDRQTIVIPTDNDEYPIITAYRYGTVKART